MRLFQGGTKRDEVKGAPRRRNIERAEATPEPPAFRRNRTITDLSTIPEVSKRARMHQLRLLRRKVGLMLGAVFVVLVIIVAGASQFTYSVRILASDTSIVQQPDLERYRQYFDEYYQRYPLERFRFLTDQERLLGWLRQSAPEIAKIAPQGLESLGVVNYEMRLRKPLVSWRVSDEQYYVDTGGVTFKKNYFAQPAVSVIDESGVDIQQGSAIASSRLLSFVGRAVALATEHGVTVTQVELPGQSMRQVYLHGDGIPVVRMTIDRGVEYQVVDMKRALTFLAANNESPLYVDVRTPGKVFYQ